MDDDAAPKSRLRPATREDAGTVAAIWHQGWRDGHLGFVPDGLLGLRSAESFAARAPERVADTTVAELDGVVVGFVMVVGDEVEQVYLSADHRGTGIADVLLDEAERQVAVAGHDRAWLAVVAGNTRARSFYERRGWIDDGSLAYRAGTATPGETVEVPSHRYVKQVTNVAHIDAAEG